MSNSGLPSGYAEDMERFKEATNADHLGLLRFKQHSTKEHQVKGQEIWVPFGPEATNLFILGKDRIRMRSPKSEDARLHHSDYSLQTNRLLGFRTLHEARTFIELSKSWENREEMCHYTRRFVRDLESNKDYEYRQHGLISDYGGLVGSVVRFIADDTRFVVGTSLWRDPEVIALSYDFAAAEYDSIDAILSSDNLYVPEKYNVREKPPTPAGTLAGDEPVVAGH